MKRLGLSQILGVGLLCIGCSTVPIQAEEQAAAANGKGFDTVIMGCNLTMQQSTGSDLVFEANTDKTSYKIDDALILEVTPESDVYISVIDQGSDPEWPERGHALFENTFIKKGDTYTFPPPNSGKLEISGPTGTNVFEVIASVAPVDDPEANSKNVNFVKADKTKANSKDESSRCTLSFEITE